MMTDTPNLLGTCAFRAMIVLAIPLAVGRPGIAEDIVFPLDAAFINVKAFGAKGDGVTDDTEAIRKASQEIHHNLTLCFPAGVYLISDSLDFKGKGREGQEINRVCVQGQSGDRTIIQPAPHSQAFQSADRPQAIICMKHSNESVRNRFNSFTLQIGEGNPGAIGIDFISCNGGSIRGVRIVSEDRTTPPHTGIYVGRGDNGPCLITDVEIAGFRSGIHTETSFGAPVVVESLGLRNQVECGVLRVALSLAVVGLRSEGTGAPAVVSRSNLTLVDAVLNTTGGECAVRSTDNLCPPNALEEN